MMMIMMMIMMMMMITKMIMMMIKMKDGCDYCGVRAHKTKRDCPAWNTKCKRCGKENHLAKVCRSKQATAAANAVYDEDTIELFTLTAGAAAFQPMTIGARRGGWSISSWSSL